MGPLGPVSSPSAGGRAPQVSCLPERSPQGLLGAHLSPGEGSGQDPGHCCAHLAAHLSSHLGRRRGASGTLGSCLAAHTARHTATQSVHIRPPSKSVSSDSDKHTCGVQQNAKMGGYPSGEGTRKVPRKSPKEAEIRSLMKNSRERSRGCSPDPREGRRGPGSLSADLQGSPRRYLPGSLGRLIPQAVNRAIVGMEPGLPNPGHPKVTPANWSARCHLVFPSFSPGAGCTVPGLTCPPASQPDPH